LNTTFKATAKLVNATADQLQTQRNRPVNNTDSSDGVQKTVHEDSATAAIFGYVGGGLMFLGIFLIILGVASEGSGSVDKMRGWAPQF